jgi:hypothetical protein
MVSHMVDDFEPYFLLEEKHTSTATRQFALTQANMQDIHLHGHFYLDPMQINTVDEQSEVCISLGLRTEVYQSGSSVLPISGFPRRVMAEGGHGIAQLGMLV